VVVSWLLVVVELAVLELPSLELALPVLLACELSPMLVLPVAASSLVATSPHPNATITTGPSKPPNRRRPPRDMGVG
jgi:hypothetical protein